MNRWFNTAGPCAPAVPYMLPPIAQRTATETATSPAGRTITVIRG